MLLSLETHFSLHRVGDYVFFESSASGAFAIRRIEELNKTATGTVWYLIKHASIYMGHKVRVKIKTGNCLLPRECGSASYVFLSESGDSIVSDTHCGQAPLGRS